MNTKFTVDEQVIFIRGYLYAQAETSHRQGLFLDMSLNELVNLYLSEWLKDK